MENRLCAAQNTFTGAITGYLYDAGGTRVAKGSLSNFNCSSGPGFAPTANYLLGSNNRPITELTVQPTADVWEHSNVYVLGNLLATYDGIGLHFQLSDWLGTRRVQTNSVGAIEETCANLPFGDGMTCQQTSLPTTEDATENHFTGQERDHETTNDHFEARYYSSVTGRFASPDPSGLYFDLALAKRIP